MLAAPPEAELLGILNRKVDSVPHALPTKRKRHRTATETAVAAPTPPVTPPPALQASVLVLNRLYMAVHVVTARRAFVLLYRELAEVIHLEDGVFANYSFASWVESSALRRHAARPHDDFVRTVNFTIQVPRVIRLMTYDRMPRQKLNLNRRNILARDQHTCQYCGHRHPPHQLSVDHVFPRSRGGPTAWDNVVCACLECNIRKGGRTPKEAGMHLRRHPERPRRNPTLLMKLANPKYESWRTWIDGAYCQSGE